MSEFTIRKSAAGDLSALLSLYTAVAAKPGGLARLENEVNAAYVENFLSASLDRGLSLLAEQGGEVLGEIHAYGSGLFCFAHVLSDLTIAVHPRAQGVGLGRQLFSLFLKQVSEELRGISRVELIARESNAKALAFYQSLGFQQEGRFANRIRNVDGSLEDDIAMAWQRPAPIVD